MPVGDSENKKSDIIIAKFRQLANTMESDVKDEDFIPDSFNNAININTSGDEKIKTKNTVISFIQSYSKKRELTTNTEWLNDEFAKYPMIWKNDDERLKATKDIVESVERFKAENNKFAEYRNKGLSRESCLKSAIETGAKAQGVTDIGKYAAEIDHALDQANTENLQLMYRLDGGINQQWHLDGFIAEQHHVDTFNLEAVAKG
ncbi:MAG: hypothetical protein LBW85_06460, partial [Deltaproteobacteria bacterium]|nr:hypothetical protein [Deltaproteobacteria bacterium]